ncbi:MAG: helix-turn-helix transcriptional regulator [Burkholderiaceae bacterium]
MSPEEAFGVVLRALRKSKGFSQERLALDAEIERNYVSLLELGKNSVSLRIYFKLCEVLEIDPAELMRRIQDQLKR